MSNETEIKRTSAGLRELLFEQLDGLRGGTVSVATAKAVAHTAATILKSVEVEMQFRDQQVALAKGGQLTALGELSLAALPAPTAASTAKAAEPAQVEQATRADHDITQLDIFRVGERVKVPNGREGTIKTISTTGRIEVAVDGEPGQLPFSAKHLTPIVEARKPITDPRAESAPRVVRGRAY